MEIAEILRSLDLDRADALPDLAQLVATYQAGPASASFWSTLLADIVEAAERWDQYRSSRGTVHPARKSV